ncbi:unnamed protein product, partial [Chrysoparadoxa australica]
PDVRRVPTISSQSLALTAFTASASSITAILSQLVHSAAMAAELPILYSFRRCPYAMRARMALCYSEIPVELREIKLRDKPAEMLAASPKGTVPVLVLPSGTVIDESLDIMSWALDQNDPQGWLTSDEQEVAKELIRQNDGEFKGWLDRYKYPQRFPDASSAEVYRSQGESFLQELETRLQQHRFLLGERQTLADVALAPFVRQFAHVDMDWFEASDYTALQLWLQEFKSSTLFVDVMKKFPPWHSGDEKLVLFERVNDKG